MLDWTLPDGGTEQGFVYDVLRSVTAADFVSETSTLCLESDAGPDRSATDAEDPTTGSVFFYIVRAENVCGADTGVDSAGVPRDARDCP